MSEQEQATELFYLQGGHASEDGLIREGVARVQPYAMAGSHVSDLYEVVLDDAVTCFFKPITGMGSAVAAAALRNYAHTQVSATLAECAAWQLAKRIGPPFDAMIAPTVLRTVRLPNGKEEVGSLQIFRPGRDRTRGFILREQGQAAWAALFDCIIGQQDRNEGNALWHEETSQIFLIDHGFAFARPGDSHGELVFWNWRVMQGQIRLTSDELGVLRTVDAACDELGRFLDQDRNEAMRKRSERMLAGRCILPPGDY